MSTQHSPEFTPTPSPPPLVAVSEVNPTGVTQPMSLSAGGALPAGSFRGPVTCPRCGSSQFVCEKKITGWGWFWIISGLANIVVSGLLMFLLVGFVTIFATPLFILIGFYSCRRLTNTCASCKHEW